VPTGSENRGTDPRTADQAITHSEQFIGRQVDPVTGGWITARHGWLLLERLESGVEGSGVVASESTNIVGPKDRHEKMELALVDKLGEGLKKGKRVNRDAVGGESDKERNRLGKGSVERGLKVQEFERSQIQGGRRGRRGEDSRHTGEKVGGAGAAAAAAAAAPRTMNWSWVAERSGRQLGV